MVTSVKARQLAQTICLKRGMVIELIGPAGAGKSTLYKSLGELGPEFIREPLPPVWNPSYFLFFVKNILALVPTLVHLLGKSERRLTREELAWMAMLNGWPELLKQQAATSRNIILMDQGPIFLIGALLGFGPSGLQIIERQAWWKKIFERWMEVIDIIVWLDASDQELTMRIREREDSHQVKGASDQEVCDFLAKWRKVYTDVMNRFQLNNPKLLVIKIDSEQFSVDEIVCKVIYEIERRDAQFQDYL